MENMTDTTIWIRGVPKGISLVKVKSVLSKYVKNVKSVKFVRSDGTNENKNDLQKIIETKLNLKSGLFRFLYY